MVSFARRTCTLAAFLALPAVAYADVIVISAGGGGQFTSLQPAVDAANEGDTLLVKTGSYSGFTVDAKSLSISADTAADVNVTSSVVVKNLGLAQTVVLAGLKVKGSLTTAMTDAPGVGLLATSNAGALRVEGCELTGSKGYGDGLQTDEECTLPNHFWGWHGAKLDQNPGGVAFVACSLTGGRAANAGVACYYGIGGVGGDALNSANTRVAVYDCMLTGGEGGDQGFRGGVGGAGARILSSAAISALIASGSTFLGGHGGDGYDYIDSQGGNGGDGVVMESGTIAWRLDDALAGGTGGLACNGNLPYPGNPGVAQSGTGNVFNFMGTRVKLIAPMVAREETPVAFTIVGAPGEHVYVRLSDATVFRAIPSWHGVLLGGQSIAPQGEHMHQAQYVMDLGLIPASGSLSGALTFGDVASARTHFVQAYSVDALGHDKAGSMVAVSVLDSSY